MQVLSKGTVRVLTSDASHYYVKMEDEDFAWWMSQTRPDVDDEHKMQVRMTDEQALNESHFNVFVPVDEYFKLKK